MVSEIDDPEQVATFLILLIVKLGGDGGLIGSTHAFRRRRLPVRVNLVGDTCVAIREEASIAAPGRLRALRRFSG